MCSQGRSDGARAAARCLFPSALGVAFFALPIPVGERYTVPFDLLVGALRDRFPGGVSVYCLGLVVLGAMGTLFSRLSVGQLSRRFTGFRSGRWLSLVRLAALPLAIVFFARVGPEILLQPAVSDLMWSTLAASVGLIIPIGAALLVLLTRFGLLELVGTLMRPVMLPLFRLPGRSALDSLTSWVGSYSVGLYMTRQLTLEGYYSRREAFTIVTCFSTVSIGFVGVVAGTLDLLPLFPLIFGSYFAAVYLLAAICCRIWPTRSIAEGYLAEARPEPPFTGSVPALAREAWKRALERADGAPAVGPLLRKGLEDGVQLAASVLGSILVVGTLALLVARETPLFEWLGRPIVPILSLLGIPDADMTAPATVAGIAEMYIPALLVREASAPARFFVAVLSVSQLIFFSAVAPMMLELFRELPVRGWQLLVLFFLRTALLIPLLAVLTRALMALGVF